MELVGLSVWGRFGGLSRSVVDRRETASGARCVHHRPTESGAVKPCRKSKTSASGTLCDSTSVRCECGRMGQDGGSCRTFGHIDAPS